MIHALQVASPAAHLLMVLALMWLMAKLGAEACHRLGLPRVVGELAAGLILGILASRFPGVIPDIAHLPVMELLAELGIVLLMFAVGLESTIPEMIRVGPAALRVALVGVVAPMGLGLAGSILLLPPGTSWLVGLFIGACLCATSIGITAQVLGERKALATPEGRVIMGAAVLDDILGLLILVLVSGLVGAASTSGPFPWGSLGRTLALALGFLAVAFSVGRLATPRLFRLADRFQSEVVLLPIALAFAFLLSWLGTLAGLATIVGAYSAGLILEPANIQNLEAREHHSLEALLHPLVASLSPLFFVLMGAKVDPRALVSPRALSLAGALTLLGIIGKYVAGYVGGKGLRPAVLGWGMVPRGEVGLIFVAAGSALTLQGAPLLSPEVQAGIVGALLLTTIAGPIGLGRALRPR